MKTKLFRYVFFVILLLTIFSSCNRFRKSSGPHYIFKTELILKHTPVKNQGQWSAGWIYATLSLIESERIAVSDSMELSATYLLRKLGGEQVKNEGHVSSFEGNPRSCLRLMEREGILTFTCFRPKLKMTEKDFCRMTTSDNLQTVCDTGFAYLPPRIGLYGAVYTPKELMESLFMRNNYVNYSCSHDIPYDEQPGKLKMFGDFGQTETYQNLSPESLVHFIRNTLLSGHTLVWMGDTAQTGYSASQGYAFLPESKASPVNPKRIHLHCLHIIGMALPQRVHPDDISEHYYICKDSHGTSGPYNGLMYLSENYIKAFTVAVYCHKPTRQQRM